eukprot:COSAG03_NODE_525_length_7158_cov_16.603768_6_plen_82_part_00
MTLGWCAAARVRPLCTQPFSALSRRGWVVRARVPLGRVGVPLGRAPGICATQAQMADDGSGRDIRVSAPPPLVITYIFGTI